MVMQSASVSEIARLSASCDGNCISGGRSHHDTALNSLKNDPGRREQEGIEYGKVEDVDNELPGVQTSLRGESTMKLKDQNGAPGNGSNSPLMPDIENELKYGQERPAGNIVGNDDDDDDDNDDDDTQKDGERGKGTEDEKDEEEEEEKEEKVVVLGLGEQRQEEEEEEEEEQEEEQEEEEHEEQEKKQQKQVQEKEEKQEGKVEDDDDASSRNSFHYRPTNMSAAEADDRTRMSTTTAANSIETDVHDDAVEKYDFDKNNFIIQTPNHPTNATKTSVVDENLPSLPEDTEITDDSLPVPSENDEINNLIRQHTDNAGK